MQKTANNVLQNEREHRGDTHYLHPKKKHNYLAGIKLVTCVPKAGTPVGYKHNILSTPENSRSRIASL